MDVKSIDAFRSYAQLSQLSKESGKGLEKAAPKDFAEVAKTVAREAVEQLESGEKTALASLSGESDAATLVQALAASELTLETATTIRDRVVEAYQEILRMPV